jgi:hypothetical protein
MAEKWHMFTDKMPSHTTWLWIWSIREQKKQLVYFYPTCEVESSWGMWAYATEHDKKHYEKDK